MSNPAETSAPLVRTLRSGIVTAGPHRRPRTVPELLREGQAAHGSSMVVRALTARAGEPQRAVVASRKVGGAVTRNRAKRRLREAIRAAGLPAEIDVVVVARAAALSAPMPQLVAELTDLVDRARARLTGDRT